MIEVVTSRDGTRHPAEPAQANPAILTVDDDPSVSRAVARDVRRQYGDRFRVVRATSGAEALGALSEIKLRGELADWLEEHDIAGGWDLAGTLVAGGVDVTWLDQIAGAVGDNLDNAVRWLAYTIDTELLMGEIDDTVGRISGLVAAKQYSQLDRAPHQTVDVHDLLDATVTMLQGKMPKGIRVVKSYDRMLPVVPAYPAELNQVWTNLIVKHHGDIRVESTPGDTRFRVLLPIAEDQNSAS